MIYVSSRGIEDTEVRFMYARRERITYIFGWISDSIVRLTRCSTTRSDFV